MRITSKDQCETGMKVRVMFPHLAEETEGMLHVEDSRVFFCQNEVEGDVCSDTHGYKYSWPLDFYFITFNSIETITETKQPAKRTRPTKEHLGYKIDGVVYSPKGIGNHSIESIANNIEEHRMLLRGLNKRMRRWNDINAKGWK